MSAADHLPDACHWPGMEDMWNEAQAAGWQPDQLAHSLTQAISKRGGLDRISSPPAWMRAVLRSRIDSGPPVQRSNLDAAAQRIESTDPALRARGLGRSTSAHPFTDPDAYGYCCLCQLPARNRVHA